MLTVYFSWNGDCILLLECWLLTSFVYFSWNVDCLLLVYTSPGLLTAYFFCILLLECWLLTSFIYFSWNVNCLLLLYTSPGMFVDCLLLLYTSPGMLTAYFFYILLLECWLLTSFLPEMNSKSAYFRNTIILTCS
jgi:hypothetical protein